MDKKIILKEVRSFTEPEKHRIIREYLSSGSTKAIIWHKYTGKEEHGTLLKWMRRLGYAPKRIVGSTLAPNRSLMSKKKTGSKSPSAHFEFVQLKKRNAELEKQLKDAELKAIAFSAMVDIAEDMFNIPIRKKLNTKPLKG